LGTGAGYTNSTGSGSVFLGYQAGYNVTGDNILVIDNQDRGAGDEPTESLIYGVFDAVPANQILTINGSVGIGTTTPGYSLEVAGSIVSKKADSSLHLSAKNTESPTVARYPASIITNYAGTTTGYPYFQTANAGGTFAAPSTLGVSKRAGLLMWSAHDGTAFREVARIDVFTGSGFAGGDNEGDMFFRVTDGVTLSNAMTILHDGNVGIGTTNPGVLLDLGTAGTKAGVLRLAGSSSGNVIVQVAANTGTWSMTLPTAVGGAGEQLTDVAGNGVTSWASAASSRQLKDIIGTVTDPNEALTQILSTPIYRFHYKPGMGTGDSQTEYVGVMADESPWAMHYNGKIVNPVNTLGYMVLGIQATNQKISDLTSVDETLIASIEELNLKINDINNFEKENDWRDNLIAWFANVENRITRIFTGEICLTDPGEEAVCINRTELQSLKALLNQPPPLTCEELGNCPPTDPPPTPPAETCSDGIQNQDETGIDTGGVCAPADPPSCEELGNCPPEDPPPSDPPPDPAP